MLDGLCGGQQFRIGTEKKAGVGIAAEAREVAARNLDANPVAGFKEIARNPEVDPSVFIF